jgi:hypothetical protein
MKEEQGSPAPATKELTTRLRKLRTQLPSSLSPRLILPRSVKQPSQSSSLGQINTNEVNKQDDATIQPPGNKSR